MYIWMKFIINLTIMFMFKKLFLINIVILFCIAISVNIVRAQNLSDKLSGYILLQVEENGEAWYVSPKDQKRYFLARPENAFQIMREKGIGARNEDLEKIPIGNLNLSNGVDSDNDGLSDMFEDAFGTNKNSEDTDRDGYNDKDEILKNYNPNGLGLLPIDNNFINSKKGLIFIQTERNGEAWYINPKDKKRYYLGRPSDAFNVMRNLGEGINNNNLEKIKIGNNLQEYNNDRYWEIYSNDFFLSLDNDKYWKDAPGISYKICSQTQKNICGHIIQHNNEYKDYLLDFYKYQAKVSNRVLQENEINNISNSIPYNVSMIPTSRKTWKHGFFYNEGEHYFHESSYGTLIINYDYSQGDGFTKEYVEKLIRTIDYKDIVKKEIAFNIVEPWNGYDLKSEKIGNKIIFFFKNNDTWLEIGQSIEIFEKSSSNNLEKAIYENILNANQKEKCDIKVSNFNSGTKAEIFAKDEFIDKNNISPETHTNICGKYAASNGVRYFYSNDNENKTRFIFVDIGQIEPCFEVDSIKFTRSNNYIDTQKFTKADTSDLDLFEANFQIKDINGNPIKNTIVGLYNINHALYFPIELEQNEEKECYNAVRRDGTFNENKNDEFIFKTNNFGQLTAKILKGNYIIFAGGEISNDPDEKEILYLQKEIFIDQKNNNIELKIEKLIDVEVLDLEKNNLDNFNLHLSYTERAPGFIPFDFNQVNKKFTLFTNNSAKILSLITKKPEKNKEGYLLMENININSSKQIIQRKISDLAELNFSCYNASNEIEDIGSVHLGPTNFYFVNFDMNFPTNENYSSKVFVDPQNMSIWYGIEKDNQFFHFNPNEGSMFSFEKGDKKNFKFGGKFDLKLKIASFNPSNFAYRNYVWFLVKDYYGNILKDYGTENSTPNVVIKKGEKVVFDKEIGDRDSTYFENFSNYSVNFEEDFKTFGSIKLINEPMENLKMDLINFESENIEFIIPKELESLKEDWTKNFENFYTQMVNLYGVKTTEKIPFRVVYDGAERAWAPIIWPPNAYECDSRNYLCWFMITHELGHPFTINKPISACSEKGAVYNEESKASFTGISAAKMVDRKIGDFIESGHPLAFKYLEDKNVCYNEIEVIQTLMFYLNKKYPNKKPNIEVITNWNTKYIEIYNKLLDKGYNHDETYGAIYSLIVEENLGLVFEKFGLASDVKITKALELINVNK